MDASAHDEGNASPVSVSATAGAQDGEFDDLLQLASQLLDAPIALIAVAEAEHFRLLAEHGYGRSLVPREFAICNAVDAATPLLLVPDAAADPRFREAPSVRENGVRFFLGFALFDSAGTQIGVLNVADTRPRATVAAGHLAMLQRFARLAARMLERRALERSRRVAEQIAHTSFSAAVMLDGHGCVASMNEAAQAMFGPTVTVGQSVQALFPAALQDEPEQVAAWLAGTQAGASDHGDDSLELRLRSATRELRTVQAVRCVLSTAPGGTALILRDVTDSQRLQQSITRSRQDPLTDTASRAALLETLSELIRQDRCFVVALLGLDNFRALNDVLGPAIGDTALQIIACRLLARMPADAHLARYGGDEFAMLLPCAADTEIETELQTLLRDIARPCEIDHHRVHLEASIGVARRVAKAESAVVDEADAGELLARAGLAMRHAKRVGGQQWRWFQPHMRTEAVDRRQLDLELRRACQEGEFELHYQPQIDLVTGAPTGAEALLRWRHPQRGLLYPGAFIDALSHSVVAPEVGRWILHRACRDAASWPQIGGRRLAVGVNLFPVQFHDGRLLDEVDRALAGSGLDPAQLELELTEHIALRNDGVAEQLIAQLRARGVRVSFDDFGTGFASLSMLHRLPIDRIKIDHSFVHNVLENRGDMAIVRSIALMARNFDLQVIAEGVETTPQADFLREIGCDEVQGFLYSHALAAIEFQRWLVCHAGGEKVDG